MLGRYLLIVVMTLFLAPAAIAEGFYAGAGIGLTQVEDDEGGLEFDDSAVGWRILVGYDFTENFAVEGAYVDAGDVEDEVLGTDIEVELTAFTISGVGLLPMNENVTLFGKLGWYDGEQEATALGITVDDDEDGLTLGGGIRYDMKNNFMLRGDLDWFDSDFDTLWSIGVGFQYYFGT